MKTTYLKNSKFYICLLIIFLVLISLANAQTKPDTAKVAQPDSVRIVLSLAEYQAYIGTLSEAIRLSREAKKASEAASITVFVLQVSEGLQERAKPIFKPKKK